MHQADGRDVRSYRVACPVSDEFNSHKLFNSLVRSAPSARRTLNFTVIAWHCGGQARGIGQIPRARIDIENYWNMTPPNQLRFIDSLIAPIRLLYFPVAMRHPWLNCNANQRNSPLTSQEITQQFETQFWALPKIVETFDHTICRSNPRSCVTSAYHITKRNSTWIIWIIISKVKLNTEPSQVSME